MSNKYKTPMLVLVGWMLALPALPALAAQVQQTRSYDYSTTTGLLTKEVVEPGSSKLCLVTGYDLDAYGNRKWSMQRNCNGSGSAFLGATELEAGTPSANGIDPRVSTAQYTYNADGSLQVVSVNAAGHQQTVAFDAAYGAMLSQQGPNTLRDAGGNLVYSQWAYDGLGRKVLEKRPDGTGTVIDRALCANVTCAAVSSVAPSYVVTTTPVAGPIDLAARTTGAQNGPYTKVFYDEFDRPLRTQTQGSDVAGSATVVYQDTRYDSLGRVQATSSAYFATQQPVWTQFMYDKLGRAIATTMPDNSRSSVTYGGLSVTTTNDLNQSTTKVRNLLGQVVQVIDANGKTLTLGYDPLGNLSTSTDALGNVTTIHYDVRGRKLDMQDPDMGSWSYDYDALGNLTQQTDARGQVTQLGYDALNRLRTRTEPTLNTSWNYDNCAQGVGALCSSTAMNGYSRTLSYDSLGRASAEVMSLGQSSYAAAITYDENGRPKTTTYPTQLRLQNVYTALGYLKQVVNANGGSPAFYWRADAADAQGRVTQQTSGNGVVTASTYDPLTSRLRITTASGPDGSVQALTYYYDTLGNLKSRQDDVTHVNTSYGYDALNRLSSESRSGGGVPGGATLAWSYDDIGNITTRSDVGSYAYNPSGPGSARPHAVTGVTGAVNGEANPGYQYDANGNLTTTSAGGGSHVAGWNSFNMVDNLTRVFGGHTSRIDFLYGSDRERVRETATKDGVQTRVTDYMNPAQGAGLFYEQESGPVGVRKKAYLSAGGQTIGVLVFDGNNVLSATQYWHKDHLGSVVAVTDAGGHVIERMAYEPFGKRRNADGTTDANGTLAAASTARGYTEHEALDEVGLVNMNGRIYDPAISRFLSADPGIEAPQFMQDYNRYSYTVNNPLKFYDPSGFDIAVDCDDCGSPWGDPSGGSGSSGGGSSSYGANYNNFGYGLGYTTNVTLASANAFSNQDLLAGLGLSFNANTYGSVDSPSMMGGCLQCGGGTSTAAALKTLGWESYWSLNDFGSGGYGRATSIAYAEGRYLDMAGNTVAGAAYAGLNLLTMGEPGAVVGMLRGGRAAIGSALNDVSEGYALGLGLFNDPITGAKLLEPFSNAVQAKTYKEVVGHWFPSEELITKAMQNAESLRFNLEGFSEKLYQQFLKDPKFRDGNVTNWELHTILNDAALLAKTVFYGAERVKVAPPVIP